MERKLRKASRTTKIVYKAIPGGRLAKSQSLPQLKLLRHQHELEYEIRTRGGILRASRAEAQLVNAYHDWVKDQDRELAVATYKGLRCDAFEQKRGNLIEAKCSAGREYIRMAVGQLFDYAYLGRKYFGKPNMAILLPERPGARLADWLLKLRIYVIWKDKDVFLDNANGLFI